MENIMTVVNDTIRLIQNKVLKALCVILTTSFIMAGHVNAAAVEIEWVKPDSYKDIENGVMGKGAFKFKVFKAINKTLTELAEQLPEQQVLHIKIHDIDLAGEVVEKINGRQRIIKQSQFPQLKFTYKLFEALPVAEESEDSGNKEKNEDEYGALLKAGGVNLKSLNFWDIRETIEKGFLRYEKNMLENWFAFTFLPRES